MRPWNLNTKSTGQPVIEPRLLRQTVPVGAHWLSPLSHRGRQYLLSIQFVFFCRKIFVGGLSRDTGDGMICKVLCSYLITEWLRERTEYVSQLWNWEDHSLSQWHSRKPAIIMSCSVLPPQIDMRDTFNVILWTSTDICIVHDNLGWKNQTTCYNRFWRAGCSRY